VFTGGVDRAIWRQHAWLNRLQSLLLMSQVPVNWFAILLPILATTLSPLAQLGWSRSREHDADLNRDLWWQR
jgi:Zn-dependent protease with chaperone function